MARRTGGSKEMTTLNAFHWKGQPSSFAPPAPAPRESYPQLDYYHRRKAGLTGTRQNPDRQWRTRPAQEAKTMSDDERELHIKHCGELMEANYAQGNREAAMEWLQAQNEAIKGRSAAQVARMEEERGFVCAN